MTGLEKAWSDLKAHRQAVEHLHMRDQFAAEPDRFERFSMSLGDLTLDYSKNRITDETLGLLLALGTAGGVENRRDAMFSGARINSTEDREVLHTALRAPADAVINVDGRNVMPDVHDVLGRALDFAEGVRTGSIAASDGKPFTDIVNIGIGGSDLGPAMVSAALSPYARPGLRNHYVSNVDGAHLHDVLAGLDPARTLFLIASKTFTTQETMTNAGSARSWVVDALGEAAAGSHFAALSTALDKVAEFGIAPDRIFGFWDWVGGRYSIWSAIGLSVMIAIGAENFRNFLAGAHHMDRHFQTAPMDRNMPVILALLGIWNRNILGIPTQAIIPYDQRLHRFPAYLQQLDMESNGKSVSLDGGAPGNDTGPVIWGEPGTNGQHAFFQLLHQGTSVVPVDFLLAANPHEQMGDHHAMLTANCLAQSESLMRGRTLAESRVQLQDKGLDAAAVDALAPHRTFPGNRPSNTLLYSKLYPFTLGSLIALYEHKVFVQGTIWGINSYDQWGVELGKELAGSLLQPVRDNGTLPGRDSSTAGLLARFQALKG
jgi:glucose-6-phosphate isomerase